MFKLLHQLLKLSHQPLIHFPQQFQQIPLLLAPEDSTPIDTFSSTISTDSIITSSKSSPNSSSSDSTSSLNSSPNYSSSSDSTLPLHSQPNLLVLFLRWGVWHAKTRVCKETKGRREKILLFCVPELASGPGACVVGRQLGRTS